MGGAFTGVPPVGIAKDSQDFGGGLAVVGGGGAGALTGKLTSGGGGLLFVEAGEGLPFGTGGGSLLGVEGGGGTQLGTELDSPGGGGLNVVEGRAAGGLSAGTAMESWEELTFATGVSSSSGRSGGVGFGKAFVSSTAGWLGGDFTGGGFGGVPTGWLGSGITGGGFGGVSTVLLLWLLGVGDCACCEVPTCVIGGGGHFSEGGAFASGACGIGGAGHFSEGGAFMVGSSCGLGKA
mmetsp:Transcript_21893/g.41782  ORF Transcript_21893/g.41782 Transcript_21893/m.41782 type:complete len:236 (-) Transcript_21893:1386-2093(-)